MFKGDRNFSVGLFVSVAIVVLLAFVLWLTGRGGNEEMSRYTLLFHRDVSGLAVGGPVKYMGMNVGSVIHMDLDSTDGKDENRGIRIRVDIEILTSTPVDQGTYASIALQGITGVAVVNLASEPGDFEPLPEPRRGRYPVIPVRDVGFAALLSSAPEIMAKLDRLLTYAGDLLGEDNQATIGNSLRNVEQLTQSLAQNRDALAALPDEVSRTLAEIRATVGTLHETIGQAQPDLSQALANVNQSSQNLSSLTGRLDALLEQHEADMSRFMEEGLAEAPALMGDTRAALRELDKLLAELKDDPSQLVHRPPAGTLEMDP